ncbi:hypothetical protein PG987_015369 [Apiospora arundinis]
MRRGVISPGGGGGGRKSPTSFHNIINPLPVIAEDEASHEDDDAGNAPKVPKVPPRSPRRVSPLAAAAAAAAKARANRSRGNGGRTPVQESEKADGHSLKSWLAKRGGWCRFVIMAALAVCAIVALAVGLTLGLRQRNKSTMPSESGEEQPVLFPAGSYAFKTALLDVADDCTSNNATFRCYPFETYSQSRSDASATYFWIITQVNSWAYQISAASNPFVPQFSNLSLTQLDANQFNERLTFSFSIHGAAIVPTTALGKGDSTSGGSGSDSNNNNNEDNNKAATCYYNDTMVTATIWTRRRAEFPANLTTPPWPYAVQVVQRTRDTPDCRDVDGNRVGGDLVPPPDRAGDCTCSYANFDL